MADRLSFVAGNWKMNLDREGARALATAVDGSWKQASKNGVELALFPPFPYLQTVGDEVDTAIGAQDIAVEDKGAFTGEVSGPMLLDVGCRYVLIGHSERRHVLMESDEIVASKLGAAVRNGLAPVLCVGETLDERESGQTHAVLERQWTSAVRDLPSDSLGTLVLAYEPVWAIGTGRNATLDQAQEAHRFLRDLASRGVSSAFADRVRIVYGGSVKPDNAAELLSAADVDGALVGGASLKADSFIAIANAAAS